MKPLKRIVYTGGPCGGKTTALGKSYEHFSQLGYRVAIVPEAATLMIRAGFNPSEFKADKRGTFQEGILAICLALEEEASRLLMAYTDRPRLMICDRGALDGKAYCHKSQWEEILERKEVKETDLLDRYEGVIHLVTAAEGAEKYYTKVNNLARHEEIELARKVDGKLLEVWKGHDQVRIIGNNTNFEGKIDRTLKAVSEMLEK